METTKPATTESEPLYQKLEPDARGLSATCRSQMRMSYLSKVEMSYDRIRLGAWRNQEFSS
jgi:hypothetical protein